MRYHLICLNTSKIGNLNFKKIQNGGYGILKIGLTKINFYNFCFQVAKLNRRKKKDAFVSYF